MQPLFCYFCKYLLLDQARPTQHAPLFGVSDENMRLSVRSAVVSTCRRQYIRNWRCCVCITPCVLSQETNWDVSYTLSQMLTLQHIVTTHHNYGNNASVLEQVLS